MARGSPGSRCSAGTIAPPARRGPHVPGAGGHDEERRARGREQGPACARPDRPGGRVRRRRRRGRTGARVRPPRHGRAGGDGDRGGLRAGPRGGARPAAAQGRPLCPPARQPRARRRPPAPAPGRALVERAGAGRAARPRHLAAGLPARPQRRQPEAPGAAVVPGRLGTCSEVLSRNLTGRPWSLTRVGAELLVTCLGGLPERDRTISALPPTRSASRPPGPSLATRSWPATAAPTRARRCPVPSAGTSACSAACSAACSRSRVARACTVYFQLVNLAEERQRVRTLRERSRGAGPVSESFVAAVEEVRATAGEAGLAALLDRLEVAPVLTA